MIFCLSRYVLLCVYEVYKELDEYDQEMIWSIIQIVKKINEKKKIEQKRVD